MRVLRSQPIWLSVMVSVTALLIAPLSAAAAPAPSSFPAELTAVGPNVFFSANDGTIGREIWVSRNAFEGTTYSLTDLNAGGDSNPTELTALGTRVLFTADDGTGRGLWSTNSTASIRELFDEAGRFPHRLTRVGGHVFFVASSPMELWMTDGTVAGTELVEAIPGSSVTEAVALNGILYFLVTTYDDDGEVWRLWRSDGTPEGTFSIKRLSTAVDPWAPWQLTSTSNRVYFILDNQNFAGGAHPPAELWRTDGTLAGTHRVKDIVPGEPDGVDDLTAVGLTLYFTTYDAEGDREVWKSNGNPGGTVKVTDINPLDSSEPSALTRVGSELYFSASDGDSRDLWRTNGNPGGTFFVDPAEPFECAFLDFDCIPAGAPAAVGTRLYFPSDANGKGIELWVSDGTELGTRMVKNINGGTAHSRPSELTALGSMVVFVAKDATHGRELWVSDGTGPGTHMIEDINP
jgi:ELWxxDGT repeat protein